VKSVKIHDYAEDGDTQTLQVITGVTEHGCVISEREYEYEVEDENDIDFGATLTGTEITMSVPQLDTDEVQVFRTLADLAEETSITADDLTLVEDE
jgi:hypothetical protein